MHAGKEITLKDVRRFAERMDRPYCQKSHAKIQSILDRYFAASEGKTMMGSAEERKNLHAELNEAAHIFGDELKAVEPELKRQGNNVRFWGGASFGLAVAGAATTIVDWLIAPGSLFSGIFLTGSALIAGAAGCGLVAQHKRKKPEEVLQTIRLVPVVLEAISVLAKEEWKAEVKKSVKP